MKFILFADDTNIFLQGKNLVEVANIMNNELSKVSSWLKCNNLTLNSSKTYYMVSYPTMEGPQDAIITTNNHVLKCVQETKFLGIILDNKLNWKNQINFIKMKISKMIGVMYRVREKKWESTT